MTFILPYVKIGDAFDFIAKSGDIYINNNHNIFPLNNNKKDLLYHLDIIIKKKKRTEFK